MKSRKFKIIGLLACLLVVPMGVMAFVVETGDALYVPESRIIEGNYYVAGQNASIDGRITGDVYYAGQSLVINGRVDGDVIAASQSVSVNGTVGGNLRAAGSDINIRGTVERGVSVAGANVNIEKSARIGWDALMATANAQVRGEIGRSLLGAGANYNLNGTIARDVVLYLNSNNKSKGAELNIGESAIIGGGVTYQSVSIANVAEKAQVKGAVVHKLSPSKPVQRPGAGGYLILLVISMLSALVVGLVLIKLWPRQIVNLAENMTDQFWPTLGWGFVTLTLMPLLALLLAVTVVGLRLAGLVMLGWVSLFMLSKIIASIVAGWWLVNKYWAAKKESLATSMVLGVIIMWIIFYIPIIGWLASLVAMWWGAGGMIMSFKKVHK